MAKITIPQSQLKVNVGQATPTGNLAMPFSLASVIGQGYGAIGKEVEKVAKKQKDLNDEIRLNEIVKDAIVRIESVSAGVSKNSDLQFAVDLFDKKTKLDQFEDLYKKENTKVQQLFKLWHAKQRNSEYVKIAGNVTKNHVAKVKDFHKETIQDIILDSASSDIQTATEASEKKKSFFGNAANAQVYTESEWKQLEKETDQGIFEARVEFGTKNHPKYILDNYDEIKDKVDPDKANAIIKKALQKISSDTAFNIKRDEFIRKADEDNKIATFTELMLRIKNDKTPETLGNIPTLDFLNDLYKEDKLNSAQYGALIRFYKEPEKIATNDGIFEVVNSQLYMAETVEDLDRLNRLVHLDTEYLKSIGIKDISTISAIIDKNKDREAFENFKYYGNLIDNVLGKIDAVAIRDGRDVEKQEQMFRTVGARMYNEYVAEGYRPEQAFSKILQTYLLDRNKVPTIYDVSQVTSISITKPSKQVADGQSSAEIFTGWRNQVLEKYKNNDINLSELQKDLASLDVMENVYNVRTEIERVNSANPKFTGFGFFENNTVLGQEATKPVVRN